ncbi:response regulator [Caenimonas aquaedulcis]|uniref:Response regulator n=1 Tax=Caenimonas aquaedulcis TaxID=2793270 RepID=A0A931MJB6_9BURK|nr:response regulator [Caenimonas aquaedulcis]MBG9390618.1 response regulator [Caenimonas aquaedulcis]
MNHTHLAECSPRKPAATHSRPASGMSFLVVEDLKVQLDATDRLLRDLGAADVEGVTSGMAALKRLRDPRLGAQVMLLDVAMPDMDGIELLQALKSSREDDPPTAVIINTACVPELLDAVELLAREYHPRVLGSITKPLTAAKLAPLLERWHASS